MNVAMFTDAYYPRVNGVAVSVQSYAEELCRMGHRVCVVCPDYTDNHVDAYGNATVFKTYFYDTAHEAADNMEVLRIPADNIAWSKEDRTIRLNQWHTIKRELDAFAVDVVHVNSEFLMGWYGVTYARRRHKALVFTFHTLWEDYLGNYVHFLPTVSLRRLGKGIVCFYLKRADEIIVPTRRIADVVRQYGVGREADVLPTGIPESVTAFDAARFAAFSACVREEFPVLGGGPVLLYVGRIVKEKNLGFLFDVLRLVRERFAGASLLLVGGGPELEPLREKARGLPYGRHICFAGYRGREELAYFYHLADVFVFPSLTETQGLVTVEAMQCGLPVVAIGEMGTADVMQGDHGGFMVANDVGEFSGRVIQLLADGELRGAKSAEARRWGRQWSLGELAPRLAAYYRKAMLAHDILRRAGPRGLAAL